MFRAANEITQTKVSTRAYAQLVIKRHYDMARLQHTCTQDKTLASNQACEACVLEKGLEREAHSRELRTREGDQRLPSPAGGPNMQDLVIKDIEARKEIGLKRYGQLLKADDGRDNLLDAYQEALDLAVYLRKELYRRDRK